MAEHNDHFDLGAYALGVLHGEEGARFERHLVECTFCADQLPTLRATGRLLREAVWVTEPPPGLARQVQVAVEEAATPRHRPMYRAWARRAVVAETAATVLRAVARRQR